MTNVKDIDQFEDPQSKAQAYLADNGGDMLKAIFARQGDLEEKYHPIEEKNVGHTLPSPFGSIHDLDGAARQRRLKEIAYRVVEELSECTNTLKNGKPWKSTHVPTDVDHCLEEAIDAFHFMIEFMLCLGLDANMLYRIYFNKASVNDFRQRTNY